MSNAIIEWNDAIHNGIVDKRYSDMSSDRLDRINVFLETIENKYNLEYLIQSNVTYTRGKKEVHCMIGYSITDEECGMTIANGLGNNIEEALINAINNFIEYHNINKDLLKS